MFNKFGKRAVSAAVVACVGAALSGCFWDNGSEPIVAASDLSVPAAAGSVAAVANTAYTFPAVAALGTASATTVSFTSTTATPSFSISSAEGTATGVTTFGSCIFTVTASTFPSAALLAIGKVVTVNPCTISVQVRGVEVGTTSASLGTLLLLGTVASAPVIKTVALDAGGNVTVGGVPLGTVPVAESTGATGGGG